MTTTPARSIVSRIRDISNWSFRSWFLYWAIIGPAVSLIPFFIFARIAAHDLMMREAEAEARGTGLPHSAYDWPSASGFSLYAFFISLCVIYYAAAVVYLHSKARKSPRTASSWLLSYI